MDLESTELIAIQISATRQHIIKQLRLVDFNTIKAREIGTHQDPVKISC